MTVLGILPEEVGEMQTIERYCDARKSSGASPEVYIRRLPLQEERRNPQLGFDPNKRMSHKKTLSADSLPLAAKVNHLSVSTLKWPEDRNSMAQSPALGRPRTASSPTLVRGRQSFKEPESTN